MTTFASPINYLPSFVDEPDEMFTALWTDLTWERRGQTPRREYYANDVPVPYVYGKGENAREYHPQVWHPAMRRLQAKLEDLTKTRFEVCFLNGYEDQSDHLGWHADDSPEMDDARPIAIISLGPKAEREIWFRPQGDKLAVERVKLQHGSLCLMLPGMQDTHYHRIPKAGFVCGERISLTFRGYVTPKTV